MSGGRKQRALAQLHRGDCAASSPGVGGGDKALHQKGQLELGLRVKQVVTGEQKQFWKVLGLKRAPDQSI